MAEGFKDWAAGNVLTAADLEDYTVRQSVMRFADATARDAALTAGIRTKGMVAFLLDVDQFTVYTGSAWTEYGQIGALTVYTPTDSNITVGNGTRTAAYFKIGRLIYFRWTLTLGSTSTIGASAAVGLPVAAASASEQVVSASFFDSGTRRYVGSGFINVSATTAGLRHTETGSGNVDSTNPFTWTTSDTITVSGFYEAAS